jgi:hypothetical protein
MIVAPVSGAIDRRDLEQIEGTVFTSETTYSYKDSEVLEKVYLTLGKENDGRLIVYELHGFTELLNDDEFNLDNCWVSYVLIN